MKYVLFHKPYGVLCQFTSEAGTTNLSSFNLPSHIYPAGRLDKDSEGLLLLTDDGPLIEKILNPKSKKEKTYWVLVERIPRDEDLKKLERGVEIENYRTRPCKIKRLDPLPLIAPRHPPVRVRKSIQDVWLEIKLTEGKNRQVRKMTASIGHPTLRLIRVQIHNLHLKGLQPGEWREIQRKDILI